MEFGGTEWGRLGTFSGRSGEGGWGALPKEEGEKWASKKR